jgi:hypothetical protein
MKKKKQKSISNYFSNIYWPGSIKVFNWQLARVYVKAEYEDGILEMSGVVGPLKNGNCLGDCGNIINVIKELANGNGELSKGWTIKKVQMLAEIWEQYRLNNLSRSCKHQKNLGWDSSVGNTKIIRTEYHKKYLPKILEMQEAINKRVKKNFWHGKPLPLQLTRAEKRAMLVKNLPEYVITNNNAKPKHSEYYTKTQTKIVPLKLLTPYEHPDGLLERPCPICGYKYDTEWKFVDVPSRVLKILKDELPIVSGNDIPVWI